VALANRPALSLADEFTGEVDSATAQRLLELFHGLNKAYGLTTIIVTHDPQIARRVDRAVAIREGKTSAETVRKVSQLEQSMVGERQVAEDSSDQEEHFLEYVVLDSAGRLQVPREYREQLGTGTRASLEVMEEGILIRPVAGHEVACAPLVAGIEEEEPRSASQGGLRGWWACLRQR